MIVITLTTLGFTMKSEVASVALPNWYLPSVTAFFFLSLAVNAVTTALIVYKILTVYSEIRGFHNTNLQAGAIDNLNGRRDLNPLVSILIESGLITFVGQLAQCLMFRLSSDFAFPLISGVVVMLYVRASCRFCRFGVFISNYYSGNFDGSCPCACRDGHFLRQ